MARDNRKQTGFRVDRKLLTDFQIRLKRDHDVDMSPVLEGWIKEYMAGEKECAPDAQQGKIPGTDIGQIPAAITRNDDSATPADPAMLEVLGLLRDVESICAQTLLEVQRQGNIVAKDHSDPTAEKNAKAIIAKANRALKRNSERTPRGPRKDRTGT